MPRYTNNLDRFPEDFMFQPTEDEARSLRSQFAISKEGRCVRRYLPYAFTEHGVAMLWSFYICGPKWGGQSWPQPPFRRLDPLKAGPSMA
jgi:hypothetical protein